ncbi:MAG: 50S ribosomal protein L18e [Candidatus Woesearchaeota archaeon]
MVKRTGPTNYQLKLLIEELEKKSADSGVKLWGRLAKDLSKPSRQRRTVNIYKIEKYAREGETILIPGKVLNQGELKKKVEVAAFSFSKTAEEKIAKVGKVMSIKELVEKNPQGKKVRILG